MNPEIMKGQYNFSSSGTYHSPVELELPKVISMINNLPLDDDPEVFGLHANANITCQQNIIKIFIDTL
jgi:dynein heavy chain